MWRSVDPGGEKIEPSLIVVKFTEAAPARTPKEINNSPMKSSSTVRPKIRFTKKSGIR